MWQEMMPPLGAGRRTAAIAVATFPAAWVQVRAVATPLGSTESDVKEVVGEEEPADAMGEDVIGGELSDVDLATAVTPETQEEPNAGAVVLMTEAPTIAPATSELAANGDEGKIAVNPVGNPLEEPAMDLNNATGNVQQDALVPTETTKPLATESSTTKAPIETLQAAEPTAIVEVTAKPFLRTQDPAVISDAVTNDAANTQAPGYLNQGSNPLVLVALAGICCIFLVLWGRKRRSSANSSSGKSGGASSKGPKVQYTQVPDEQPFSHSQGDDDDYCDDFKEDTFANDRDNWDDWEGNSTQTQVSQLNPFAASPSAPRPTTPRQNTSNASLFKLAQPLPPPPQQHVQLQEAAITGKGDLLPSSVESNSSSDSFEVVSDEAHAPPTSNREATTDVEMEGENVDDLFSQFGMVPTFKKSAVVPPPPAAKSAAPASHPATTAQSSSVSLLPTAAEASALFAAELDDELTAVDAADEWGEDDEWVKGI